ncbi:TonB-dependent receptor domain-containing protein [Helicobacter pullorum]|uniref:TonB-dependent receptor domain-containing protein n=1 Tax=Helicobacter pullorum TaxID=35818 RepID=UPI00211CF59B|nr:TonB-dependent receptor [Helicobacter pullorum]
MGKFVVRGLLALFIPNRGKNQARGIEIGANSASFNGFSIEATYTYLEKFYKGTYQDGTRELNPFGGERIEDIPRHIAMLKLNYKKGKFSSYLRGNGRFDTLSNISYMGKYKDFYTFDLGLSYKMTKFSSISFAVNNLFDQNYFKPFGYPSGRRTMYDNEYQTFNERRNFWISYKMDF